MTRGPACVPMTGTDDPRDDLGLGHDRVEEVEQLVEVGCVAVEDGEVLDRLGADVVDEGAQRFRAGADLPASSTTPSRTSTTGLIESIDPSRARALPIRPPRLRNSSVSSEPNSFVRSRRSVTSATIDSRSAPSWAAARGDETEAPETHRTGQRVDDLDRAVVGDGLRGDGRGLHRRREARRQVDAHDAGRAAVGEAPGSAPRTRRRTAPPSRAGPTTS